MAQQRFRVVGMTCEHCVAAVSDEVSVIEGVSDVSIELVVGGESIVVVDADQELSVDVVRAAVDEAGYELVG